MSRPIIVAALLGMLASCQDPEVRSGAPATGTPAPDFQAVSLAGDTLSLQALQGRPVLLNLWATWCLPCRRETPYLQDVHARFEPRGLQVVGVSVDSRGAVRDVERFMEEFGVTYRILHDPAMRSMDAFSAIGLPATYLIGSDGTLLWWRLGPVEEGDRGFEAALEAAVEQTGESH